MAVELPAEPLGWPLLNSLSQFKNAQVKSIATGDVPPKNRIDPSLSLGLFNARELSVMERMH